MAKDRIAVNVSTKALRDMLDEQPEVVAELQKMACEKIAEEITRKARSMDAGQIEKRARQVVDEVFRKFANRYSFPDVAKKRVEEITIDKIETLAGVEKGNLRREFVDILNLKAAEAVKILQEAMNKSHTEHRESLREDIRKIAREEFFEVLREARDQ